jgi:hypothetical protein
MVQVVAHPLDALKSVEGKVAVASHPVHVFTVHPEGTR